MLSRPMILSVAAILVASCASQSAASPSRAQRTTSSRPSGAAAAPSLAAPSLSTSPRTPGSWTTVGSLATGRNLHTATLLFDGRVLIVGGETSTVHPDGSVSNEPIASTETYDPATRKFRRVAPMLEPRVDHTATLLADGRVLVAGGASQERPPGCDGGCDFSLATTELFDPATNAWTAGGNLNVARSSAAATLLPDGRVLLAGGYDHGGGRSLASSELFDPATGIWKRTGDLRDPGAASAWAATILLFDGSVVAIGGPDGRGGTLPSERYHQATGMWTVSGAMPAALSGTATRLLDGRVLVSGNPGDPPAGSSAAIFDPTTDLWTATGALATPRTGQATTILPDGRVLTVGGYDMSANGGLSTTELFDPASGTWSAGRSLSSGRSNATATLVEGGSVLLVGGNGDAMAMVAAVELWTPGG